MEALILLDGDNTLWDTNRVFADAQQELLLELTNRGLRVDSAQGLSELRKLDQQLIKLLGRSEYDFVLLWRALVNSYSEENNDLQSVVHTPVLGEDKVIEKFMQKLKAFPELLPGVLESVNYLKKSLSSSTGVVFGIFSEGDPGRLQKTLEYHKDLSALMDFIAIGPKTPEHYRDIINRQSASPKRAYMIGDSLQKDIQAAQVAGYYTVFIPSNYTEQNYGVALNIHPEYTVTHLGEVAKIITPQILKT